MIREETRQKRQQVRSISRLLGAFGLVLSGIVSAQDDDLCQSVYLDGISEFSQGHYQPAADAFLRAVRLSPAPAIDPDEYVPYIYLAAAYFESGDAHAARDALEQSRIFGVAQTTETGKELEERYAGLILTAVPELGDGYDSPLASPIGGESVALSDAEVEAIKTRVLKRCSLSADSNPHRLPWYFHYEFGVDLMEAGDAQRALNSFVTGANVREEPKRSKRMYGMWYIDYLPYYQIAIAHSRLGDWRSADQAMRTSRQYGEIDEDSPTWQEYQQLEQLIQSNVTPFDS